MDKTVAMMESSLSLVFDFNQEVRKVAAEPEMIAPPTIYKGFFSPAKRKPKQIPGRTEWEMASPKRALLSKKLKVPT